MCYEQPLCRWFRFNPVSRTNKCVKPKDQVCPAGEEDLEIIEEASEKVIVPNKFIEPGFW